LVGRMKIRRSSERRKSAVCRRALGASGGGWLG